MTLEESYKAETGAEPRRLTEVATNCQFDHPVELSIYTDEYVWWLETQIESNAKFKPIEVASRAPCSCSSGYNPECQSARSYVDLRNLWIGMIACKTAMTY